MRRRRRSGPGGFRRFAAAHASGGAGGGPRRAGRRPWRRRRGVRPRRPGPRTVRPGRRGGGRGAGRGSPRRGSGSRSRWHPGRSSAGRGRRGPPRSLDPGSRPANPPRPREPRTNSWAVAPSSGSRTPGAPSRVRYSVTGRSASPARRVRTWSITGSRARSRARRLSSEPATATITGSVLVRSSPPGYDLPLPGAGLAQVGARKSARGRVSGESVGTPPDRSVIQAGPRTGGRTSGCGLRSGRTPLPSLPTRTRPTPRV